MFELQATHSFYTFAPLSHDDGSAPTHNMTGVLMRVTVLLGIVLVIAGCSTKDAPSPADTMTTAAAPAEPVALSLESVAGTWNTKVMPMDKDTTLTTHILTASGDPAGWSFLQPSGENVKVRDVTLSGDSITTAAGPFMSGVRAEMRVKDLRTTYRLQNGKLVGVTTAHYETTGPDSVRQFRLEGTKQ
jgi:hypothetical protein